MDKDKELKAFASGTRHFEASPKPTLEEALGTLRKNIRRRPYLRTERQMETSKRISDRIMGERDDD